MKRYVLLLILCLVLLTGCGITRIDRYGYKEKVDKILSLDIKLHNTIGKGYKYYAPKGVVRTYSNSYNDILKRDKQYYYLYVDVVGYYYKTDQEYKIKDDLYASFKIKRGKKTGYVDIKRKGVDKLYVQMYYNYAKIEAYVKEENLSNAVEDMTYILSSVKFNDSLLKKMYESGDLSSKEESYKLFDNKEKEGNFLEYIEEYDKYDGEDEIIQEETEFEISTTTTANKETTTKEK